MRLLILVLAAGAVLMPGLARAQFNFAPGTYHLANGAKGTASLKLVLAEGGKPTRMVGIKNEEERTFRSAEVLAFTTDNHRFVQSKDFRLRLGTDAGFKDPALLEVLETGAVELYYYYYLVDMGPSITAHVKLPVLRKAGTTTFFAYSPGRTPGLDPKQAPGGFVASLFPADPVLQKQFAANAVPRAQLAAVVRAYNQGVRLPH